MGAERMNSREFLWNCCECKNPNSDGSREVIQWSEMWRLPGPPNTFIESIAMFQADGVQVIGIDYRDGNGFDCYVAADKTNSLAREVDAIIAEFD